MALYTRKRSEYVKLTREQIRKLRRTNEVVQLQTDAKAAARVLRALSFWMISVDKRAMKLDRADLMVTRTPNVDRLLSMADKIDRDVHELRKS